jgi:hypothetical protein
MKNLFKVLVINQKGRDHLEDLVVDGKIILLKYGGRVWTGFIWVRIGTSGELL